MSVQITYFVHGATIENETGRASGWNDSVLTARGIREAQMARDQREKIAYELVISSDLKRAQQTASVIFGRASFKTDNRLREADYGEFNGQKHHFKDSMMKYVESPFPDGESYRDVQKRMQSLIDELQREHDGQRIAMVAHQGPQLALEVILNGKSWKQAIDEDWRRRGAWQPGWAYTIP